MAHDPAVTLQRAQELRVAVGVSEAEPSPIRIQQAIDVYVEQFDFWYRKQWDRILGRYVQRIVRRTNPFVRRAQLGQCTALQFAEALVNDWDSRNFVTAGGQALEALAIALGPHCQKSEAEGVDMRRVDPADPAAVYLYVVKSGAVTRNTDIVSKMKTNLRKAEKLARQSHSTKSVRLNYATCVGTTASTFEDGIDRPSSARFWAEVTGLDEDRAVGLVWTMAAEAAGAIPFPLANRRALIAQTAKYIESEAVLGQVDWQFLVRTVTEPPTAVKAQHLRRDKAAREQGAAVLAAAMADHL